MTQTPELLFATIRENLCLGRDFSDEALLKALNDAQIDTLVMSLPGGLDYLISDAGGYLSGGQAQRIALARVFLHKPKLLLLDEPTANLDDATAQAFMQQLAQYSEQGGMLIMTSHRPSDRHFFNKVITMEALSDA
jgi:ATP-binding cassette subfamily C protein CydD